MKHESCVDCAADLGGGMCRDNLEHECAAGGGYEAYREKAAPKAQPEEQYILTLTRDQAVMVKQACELYARLRIGQFEHITEKILDVRDVTDYCNRRDSANDLLKAAACIILGKNIYGTPEGKKDKPHCRAWNIYAAIRYCMAWHDNPEGGWAVCFDKPFPWGGEAVPECKVITPNGSGK